VHVFSGLGSEFQIQAKVKEFQAVVLFRSINHSAAVSAKDFTGNKEIIERYCPYPVPYMYQLKYVKHNVSKKCFNLAFLESLCIHFEQNVHIKS
jgi:hypothetical protein